MCLVNILSKYIDYTNESRKWIFTYIFFTEGVSLKIIKKIERDIVLKVKIFIELCWVNIFKLLKNNVEKTFNYHQTICL
jgi:hypothetical protein